MHNKLIEILNNFVASTYTVYTS